MSEATFAHAKILREITHSQINLEVAIADMHDTVLRTRATIEETLRLLRQTPSE